MSNVAKPLPRVASILSKSMIYKIKSNTYSVLLFLFFSIYDFYKTLTISSIVVYPRIALRMPSSFIEIKSLFRADLIISDTGAADLMSSRISSSRDIISKSQTRHLYPVLLQCLQPHGL